MGRKNVKPKCKHNLSKSEEDDLRQNVDQLLKISTNIDNNLNVSQALETQKEISKIIDSINVLEKSKDKIEIGDRYDKNTIDAFLNWFKDNEGIMQGCGIKKFENFDLGLVAEQDIPYGSLFIAVPRKLMLSVDSINQSLLKELFDKDQMLKNMPNVSLAIYLLVEKFTKNSFYKPYIDILPKTYNTILYFSIEELNELKGSPTLEFSLKLIKNITRQYAYFYFLFQKSDDPASKLLRPYFTFKEYCWAVSTVMTRQNVIPSKNGGTTYALIPLWDFGNHKNGTISTDYNFDLSRSECLAFEDYKKGEQLFIFYGPRNNAEFFKHNGFVYDKNEHDCYYLQLGISKADKLQNKRIELLEKLSLGRFNEFCLLKNHYTFNGKLLAFARIFNMEEDVLDEWLRKDNVEILEQQHFVLNEKLEQKVYIFLKGRLNLLLASYSTSLDEDKKLIEKEDITSNTKLAIKMRISEKSLIADRLNTLKKIFEGDNITNEII